MDDDSSEFLQEDCDSIATEIKEQDERIRLKRRWLLGLDTTSFLEPECVPESLLREDDLFYETAKSRVEEAFGFCNKAESKSQCDAAVKKVLNELDKLSTQTLAAMKRKLDGSITIPSLLIKPSSAEKRMVLINQVKQASEKMMMSEQEINNNNKLTKAMSLVDLSLKLTPGSGYNNTPTVFCHFSPETKKLQKEIVKAVWLLREARVDAAFERVGLILDPEAAPQVLNHSLRFAVERMLIEYLFECSDMDVVPISLTNALSFINNKITTPTSLVDHRVFPEEAVEEETECVLNVSAQVKQIAWECLPEYELDQDFGDAYMEKLEDSGDDDDYSQDDDAWDTSDPLDQDKVVGAECSVLNPTDATNQHHISSSLVIRDLTESIIRAHPRSLFVTPTSNRHDISTTIKAERDIKVGVDNQISPPSLYSLVNIKSDDHGPIKRKKNQYLAVQEICDDTSLVAYNLMGRLLEKFADQKGLDLEVDQRSYLRGESRLQGDVKGEASEEKQTSQFQEKSDEFITLSAVQEIIPSLDMSVLLKLKELME